MYKEFHQIGAISLGIPVTKDPPKKWEMMQLQFKEAYSKDNWLKVEVSESIRKKEIVWKRVCVYERQVHILLWIKWGLHLSLSCGEWSQGPWPWAWTCLLSILYSFLLLLSLSLSPPRPFCYVRTPYWCMWKNLCWFLWSLVRFTCANKKGLLTCKLCLGQYQQRIKTSPGLSQESGIWLLPLGKKREVPESHYRGDFFQSMIIKSYQLFPSLSSYWQLSTEGGYNIMPG